MEPAAERDQATHDIAGGPGSRRPGRTGFLVTAIPLVLLFLPLLTHRSPQANVWTFSARYATFLAVAAGVALAIALIVGIVCRLSRSLAPAFAAALALAGLVVGCLLVETVLTYQLRLEDAFTEYAAWGHKRSLLFAFEAKPSNTWTNVGATYTTDRFGFRTHVRGAWEADRGPRIFTLGESSVFGYGLNDDQTWPHRLEEKLRSRLADPTLDIVNAGNNGHTSLQSLFRFYARVLPRKPTSVVLYFGPNDLYGTGPDRLMISEKILFSGSVAQFWAATTEGENLYARSLLFYVAQQRVPALGRLMHSDAAALEETSDDRGPPGETPSQEEQRLLDTIGGAYIENVRTICLISRAKGIAPILMTFMQDMGLARPKLLLEHNNALLRTLAAEELIPLIDVAAAFAPVADKASYFFADHYHPNTKGAEFIASVVADHWPANTAP